jgi:PLP dependent protein
MSEKLSVDFETAEFLKNNFNNVRCRIKAASNGADVKLVGATKTVDASVINYAAENLGLTDIGENRVQELVAKYDSLQKERLNIHFIGRLQTNKVKYIIDKVCLIQSVDTVELAAEIDKQARKHGRIMDVLIEVNIAGEISKGGATPDDVVKLAEKISEMPNVRLVGLMSVPPKDDSEEEYRIHFKKTGELLEILCEKRLVAVENPVLSMGMSDSYESAVECGANMVRIGSALFGARDYNVRKQN